MRKGPMKEVRVATVSAERSRALPDGGVVVIVHCPRGEVFALLPLLVSGMDMI
jgi:hypothetical protein